MNVLYQTDDGRTQIDVRLENDTVWLTQDQMAELFQMTPQNNTGFTNSTNLLCAGNRRLRRKFVKLVIIRTIREIRLNSLLKRKGWESSIS